MDSAGAQEIVRDAPPGPPEIYCPFCRKWVHGSQYLSGVFPPGGPDRGSYWIAGIITHYRHEHIHYYNRGVGYAARFHSYDKFKVLVNNRIKRRILRQQFKFLKANNINKDHFIKLSNNDRETMILINSKFKLNLKIKGQSRLFEF